MPLETIFGSLISTIEGLSRVHSALGDGSTQTLQDLQTSLAYHRAQIIAYQATTRFLLKKHGSFLQLFDKTFASQQERIMLDDSATIKVITVITFIYLSFTVVGVSYDIRST